MKLLNRILAGNCVYGLYTQSWPTLPRLRHLARESFCVDARNVADWFNDLYPAESEVPPYIHTCPLWKLPFPVMWCEFESSLDVMQFGVMLEVQVDDGGIDAHLFAYDLENKPKEAIHVTTYTGYANEDHALYRVDVASSNMITGSDEEREEAEGILETLRNDRTFSAMLDNASHITAATIAFFHCKNITIRRLDHTGHNQSRSKRRKGIPTPTFHVIEVHKKTTHTLSDSDNSSSSKGAPMPAQFVRGHFKRFTGDSKLFGKRNGMWFWNFHARGDGDPLKSEYRTWPPEGTHTRKCLVQLDQ